MAADGKQGSHSPLVLGLLDRQSGIFAPGVSLEQGIKNACEAVEDLSGVDIRQSPTDMKLYHVRDFTLHPAAAERPQDVSEGAGSADTPTSQYEIVAYLKRQGLGRIAVRVSEGLGLEEIDDLKHVEFEEIGQLEWLKPVQKKKLLELVREETARLMSADDNEHSADDTISQGDSTPLARSLGSSDTTDFESDSEDVLVAARNGGNCGEFQEHMTVSYEASSSASDWRMRTRSGKPLTGAAAGPCACSCGFVSHTMQHWTRGCVKNGAMSPPTAPAKTSCCPF